jgi:hypothetical protein
MDTILMLSSARRGRAGCTTRGPFDALDALTCDGQRPAACVHVEVRGESQNRVLVNAFMRDATD